MRIRRMTEQDIPVVAELEKQIFPDPWSEDSFRHEVKKNPFSIPLILEDDGRIIGYAILWKIFEEFHIANIAIAPERQHQGVGTFFMNEILTYAEGCHYALLEVRESNLPAIRLYRKFGFEPILQRKKYYRNGENAFIMRKQLKSRVTH